MAKKPASNDRRKRIDDIKSKQKKAERRTTYIFVAISVLVAAGLIAGAVVFGGAGKDIALESLGVKKADAGCGEVNEAPGEISGRHVGPGATSAELESIRTVSYDRTPPWGGDHYVQTAPPNRQFYDRDDAVDAIPERLVHNLEHGYVVVWYDAQASDDDIDTLRRVSRAVDDVSRRFGPKFVVAPYTRGDFDGDTNVGLTAWGASQLCEGVSGEAIQEFIDLYRAPGGDKAKAPEPNAG